MAPGPNLNFGFCLVVSIVFLTELVISGSGSSIRVVCRVVDMVMANVTNINVWSDVISDEVSWRTPSHCQRHRRGKIDNGTSSSLKTFHQLWVEVVIKMVYMYYLTTYSLSIRDGHVPIFSDASQIVKENQNVETNLMIITVSLVEIEYVKENCNTINLRSREKHLNSIPPKKLPTLKVDDSAGWLYLYSSLCQCWWVVKPTF